MKPQGTRHKTVKFSLEEISDIESFLAINPLFDFSTLARAAIKEFIRNPSIAIKPLNTKKRILKREKAHASGF